MLVFTVEVYDPDRHWTQAPRRTYLKWAIHFISMSR